MTHSRITPKTRSRAQSLREGMTPPERILWRQLKSLKACGCHFRRQTPIGPYIADFAWLSAGLIVELDDNSHSGDAAQLHDAKRDGFLTEQGFTILRFANQDVTRNIEGVVETIIAEIDGPPPLAPPHKGEGNTSARKEGDLT